MDHLFQFITHCPSLGPSIPIYHTLPQSRSIHKWVNHTLNLDQCMWNTCAPHSHDHCYSGFTWPLLLRIGIQISTNSLDPVHMAECAGVVTMCWHCVVNDVILKHNLVWVKWRIWRQWWWWCFTLAYYGLDKGNWGVPGGQEVAEAEG